ncbi:MAG: MGMT family protein [Planctomycetes bacterium]|nr:MGMT family protein [Planctomycetota bacterium]
MKPSTSKIDGISICESDLTNVVIASSGGKIVFTRLFEKRTSLDKFLKKEKLDKIAESPASKKLAAAISKYLKARTVSKDPFVGFELDFASQPEFYAECMQKLRTVPAGKAVTYKKVATMAGNPKAVRAAGGANRTNPWPIVVPCHRVVHEDGRLGNYSAEGGPALKAELLKKEGVQLTFKGELYAPKEYLLS